MVMTTFLPHFPSHPSGEVLDRLVLPPPETVRLQTPNGPVTVSWESGTATSVHGLAVFFIEFLHLSGLWSTLVDRCPLRRTSPNAPDVATVVGWVAPDGPGAQAANSAAPVAPNSASASLRLRMRPTC